MRAALFASVVAVAAVPACAHAAESALATCAPVDVAAAVRCIDQYGADTLKRDFREMTYKDLSSAHHGFGMWMRNNWGLWKGAPLADFMRERGVTHPDDMSGEILVAYWLSTHGCRLNWNDLTALRAAGERADKGQAPCEAV